jgi:hypothetical protein
MTDKDQQLEQFREAVDRKAEAAEAASQASGPSAAGPDPDAADPGVQRSRIEHGRPQDVQSVRDKNTGKGKKTADKWNQ